MIPNEIPGGFDDLEPIHDGADLEPLLDGDDLEPIEPEIPVHVPEAEPTLEIPEEEELPDILQPEPMEEAPPVEELVEPESAPEPEPEEGPAWEDKEVPLGVAAVSAAAIAGDAAAGVAAETPVTAAAAEEPKSEKRRQPQGKRELEKAPLIQLKAAQFLMIACFLPWADPSADWLPADLEKLICDLGVWIAVQAQLAHGGEKAMGFMKGLVKGGPRNGVLLGFVVSLIGLAPIATDFTSSILLEKLSLIGAGFTYAHIVGYRLGGGFNPLYAFAFTVPLFGGIPGLMNAFGADASAPAKLLGGLGAFGALWFGAQGVRALVLAMIEAKREGEAKKKATLEARREARKAGKKVEPRTPRKPRS